MTNSFRRITACLSLVSAAALSAQTSAVPELTLQECINRALSKNFELEIGRFAPQIAKDNIESAQAGYEPILSLSGSHSEYNNDATTSAPSTSSTSSICAPASVNDSSAAPP